MSETSDFIRKMFGEGDRKRDEGLMTPYTIERVDDIAYGADEQWQVLDVYRPKNRKGKKLPVIISVHGGGWVYGDKECYQYYCMNLAERGFAVVNFSYRLAPEHKYPAPLEDLNTVCTWTMEHAGVYGFDTAHIFAVGDSAGAHCLGLYAAACTNPEYAAEYEFEIPEGLQFQAIALNCGCYKVQFVPGEKNETANLMADYLPEQGSEQEQRKISIVNFVTEQFPPVYLMTAVKDFLREEMPVMKAKLEECQIPYEAKIYGSDTNELGHVFHLDIKSEASEQCNDEECAFFKKYL